MTSENHHVGDGSRSVTEVVARVGEVEPGQMKMARVGDRRIVLACTADGLSAIDNACPHQGYGLATGSLDGDLVTCQWHNWKFRVTDGRCIVGEEDVEAHPVSIVGDEVSVTVTEPSDEQRRSRLWPSIDRAISGDYRGQIARDSARLLAAGADPVDIVWRGIALGVPRNEWGIGHEMANAADCLSYVDLFDGLERALPVTQALAGISEQTRDRPVYEPPEPDASVDLHSAIENEDADGAVAAVRAMIADGLPVEAVREVCIEAVGRHHLSYGHGAIYVQKAFELLDRAGWERADDLLPYLIRTIVYMTREDTLPYMAKAMRAISDLDLEALAAAPARGGGDVHELATRLLDAQEPPIHVAHEAAVSGEFGVEGVLDAVSLAVSQRMLRYDASNERFDDRTFGWLDISHGLTYSRAVRWAWRAHRSVDTARLVLFAVFLCFDTGRLERRTRVAETTPETGVVSVTDLVGAVTAGDQVGAVAAAQAGSIDEVGRTLARLSMSDAAGSFIVAAHLVKGSLAAWEEADTIGSNLPLMAMARLAAAPRAERFVANSVAEAIAFVQTGQPPVR